MPPQPLISRNYKGDVPMGEIDHFMPLLMQHEEEGSLAPLLSHGRVHFLWIKHSNLYCIQPRCWAGGGGSAEVRSCRLHLHGAGGSRCAARFP